MKTLAKSALAGLAVAVSFALAPMSAQASSYTECVPFNYLWDVCTTYEFDFNTGTWLPVDSVMVFTGTFDTIDP